MKKFENIVNVIARSGDNHDVAISLIKECRDREPLFTRAACFWRLPRLRLAMTMKNILAITFSTLALAFVLCLGVAGEARAACNGATATTAGTDEDGDYCGTWDCGATGSNVTCTLSKGTLTISGEGAMRNYSWGYSSSPNVDTFNSSAPWSEKMVNKAIIEGNVTKIGASTFVGEKYLTEISGTENLSVLGDFSFDYTGLTSIDIPNVTTIGDWAFQKAPLQYINMRDNVKYGGNTFRLTAIPGPCTTNPETGIKTCGSCGDKYVKSGTGCVTAENCGVGYYADEASKKCLSCGDKYVKSGTGCVTAENCGAGYYADETSKRCLYCPYGKVGYKGQCLDEYPFAKKHWTPAEAAQWLNEDNNTITLTFKK